jgi:toxin-antitoxin system PIN domain toxin
VTKRRAALLDVNVLIALFDETHVHHEIAHEWFAEHRAGGWATCAITENGFLRILTHPRSAVDQDRAAVFASLRAFCDSRAHVFWNDTVSLRDETLFDPSVIVSHRQLTDVYLLALAVRMKGRLATFDSSIPLRAVRGATVDTLTVLSPA